MIVLVGFMGAGKTAVGRALARRLGLPFVDADRLIEERHGPIPEIFDQLGETGFRAIEAATVADCLAGPTAVLALGGGAVETPDVRAALAGHEVWWLRVSLADALARVQGDPHRPVLADPGIEARFDARQALYAQVATHTLDVGSGGVSDVVTRLLAARRAARLPRPSSR